MSAMMLAPSHSEDSSVLGVRSRSNSMDTSQLSQNNTPRARFLDGTRSRSESIGQSRSESIDASGGVSIHSVMADPALKELFKWHAVSVFAFENIFFIDQVDQDWRSLFAEGATPSGPAKRAVADTLIKTFIGDNAPWEITVDSKIRRAFEKYSDDDLDENTFDKAYTLVMRDLARSMTQFQTTEVFLSYVNNRDCVDAIFADDGNVAPQSQAQMLARIRNLYKTTSEVKFEQDDTLLPNFTHRSMVRGKQCGFAKKVSQTGVIELYDMTPEMLASFPLSLLTNQTQRRRAASLFGGPPGGFGKDKSFSVDSGSAVKEPRRFKLSFSGRSRSVSVASSKKQTPVIAVRIRDSQGREFGPIAVSDVQMWWKFHVLRSTTLISVDDGKTFQPVSDLPEVFPQSKRVQMMDPLS